MTNVLQTLLPYDGHENRRFVIGLSAGGEIRLLQSGDEPIAELVYTDGTLTIRDLGGSLAVFVDDVECRGRVALRNGHVLRIGEQCWTINSLSDPIDEPAAAPTAHDGLAISLRDVRFEVRVGSNPIKPKKTLTLLNDVNLDIRPGEFVGIVGPSGSGKSTLIRVLNGDYTPTGTVTINGCNAPDYLEENSHKMAYLPQELILHDALTPRTALTYSAELRGIENPAAMVEQVLGQVGMTDRADVVIRNLSGGQKKRVALASELLNRPEALFLDEATSGLDPAGEHEMMLLFRQLADSGITTVCITHFPEHLTLCDRLLVVNRGMLAYDGPPADVLRHFQIDSIDEIYGVLQRTEMQTPFERNLPPVTPAPSLERVSNTHPLVDELKNSGEQLPTLLRRYIQILLGDKKHILFLLLQAPIIAALIGLTFGNILIDFAEQHASDWKQVAFLLLLAVTWCSSTNSIREIVKEKHIFRHERRYRLNAASYLLSKFALLGGIGVIQGWIMLIVLKAITGLDTDFLAVTTTITLIALTGTAIGLMISTISKSSEQAVTILPIIVIAQAVYSGGLARMTGLNLMIAMLFSSSFWGLEAFKTTLTTSLINATFPGAPGHYQPPILGRPFPIEADLVAIVAQAVILLAVSLVFLTGRSRKGD